jgi:hypothetical protein
MLNWWKLEIGLNLPVGLPIVASPMLGFSVGYCEKRQASVDILDALQK